MLQTKISYLMVAAIAGIFIATGGPASSQPAGAVAKTSSLLCKLAAGGRGIIRGYVMLTFSNVGTSTVPKGQTVFAKKDSKTVKFTFQKDVPSGGAATFKTSNRAFMSEGECEGWYVPK